MVNYIKFLNESLKYFFDDCKKSPNSNKYDFYDPLFLLTMILM